MCYTSSTTSFRPTCGLPEQIGLYKETDTNMPLSIRYISFARDSNTLPLLQNCIYITLQYCTLEPLSSIRVGPFKPLLQTITIEHNMSHVSMI